MNTGTTANIQRWRTPQADRILDALGNPVRRDILGFLRDEALSVGAIAERLPISRPAVSKHLRILQQAELVAHRTQGTQNIFYLQPTGFREAQAYLDAFWDEALLNFKRFAEDKDTP